MLSVFNLASCASLKAASSFLGVGSAASNGINTELTVGDKQEEINTNVGETNTKQQAEEITNYVDNIPPFVLLMLVLGWLLPSPTEMWKGFLNLFSFWRNRDVR